MLLLPYTYYIFYDTWYLMCKTLEKFKDLGLETGIHELYTYIIYHYYIQWQKLFSRFWLTTVTSRINSCIDQKTQYLHTDNGRHLHGLNTCLEMTRDRTSYGSAVTNTTSAVPTYCQKMYIGDNNKNNNITQGKRMSNHSSTQLFIKTSLFSFQ